MAVMWSVILYTVLAVAAFYFILLQPVLKNQKEQRKAVQTLQVGDEVVTTGGLIGEVMDVITAGGRADRDHPRTRARCARARGHRRHLAPPHHPRAGAGTRQRTNPPGRFPSPVRSTTTLLLFLFVIALTVFAVIVVFPSDPGRYLPGRLLAGRQGLVDGQL